jgi:rubrerythrin
MNDRKVPDVKDYKIASIREYRNDGVFDSIRLDDGTYTEFTRVSNEVLEAERKASDEKKAKRIAEAGHDCYADENTRHGLFNRPDGSQGDYYACTICGETTQVG